MTALANSINTKAGSSGAKDLDGLKNAVDSIDTGGGAQVESLSVTENGTYTAQTGKAYSPVVVSVANSYAASDEGKVVSNGALAAQTSVTLDDNGTYDTTLNNEVIIAILTPEGVWF